MNSNAKKSFGIFMMDMIHEMGNVDKESYPLIFIVKDPKAKKWELKKNLQTPNIDKKEPILVKPIETKDDKLARNTTM